MAINFNRVQGSEALQKLTLFYHIVIPFCSSKDEVFSDSKSVYISFHGFKETLRLIQDTLWIKVVEETLGLIQDTLWIKVVEETLGIIQDTLWIKVVEETLGLMSY